MENIYYGKHSFNTSTFLLTLDLRIKNSQSVLETALSNKVAEEEL